MDALSKPFNDLCDEVSDVRFKPTRETVEKYELMLEQVLLLAKTLDLKLGLAARLIKEEDKAAVEKSFGIHQELYYFDYRWVVSIIRKQVKSKNDRNRLLAFLSDIEEDRNRQLADIIARLGGEISAS
jgi:hypothetical protein